MAAALDEIGSGGVIDTVDILPAMEWQNAVVSIETLSERMGLSDHLSIHREFKSYTWWLKKAIEAQLDTSFEPYDFIFIDGAHNWTIDAAAFFLCERLLKQDGWVLFDDLKYTYAAMISADSRVETAGVSHYTMSQDEINEPAVGKILELLVRHHEHFGEFRYSQNGDWGWARKVSATQARTVTAHTRYSVVDNLQRLAKGIRRRLRR